MGVVHIKEKGDPHTHYEPLRKTNVDSAKKEAMCGGRRDQAGSGTPVKHIIATWLNLHLLRFNLSNKYHIWYAPTVRWSHLLPPSFWKVLFFRLVTCLSYKCRKPSALTWPYAAVYSLTHNHSEFNYLWFSLRLSFFCSLRVWQKEKWGWWW